MYLLRGECTDALGEPRLQSHVYICIKTMGQIYMYTDTTYEYMHI